MSEPRIPAFDVDWCASQLEDFLPFDATFRVIHEVEYRRQSNTRRTRVRRIEIDFGGTRTITVEGESLAVLLDRAVAATEERGLMPEEETP